MAMYELIQILSQEKEKSRKFFACSNHISVQDFSDLKIISPDSQDVDSIFIVIVMHDDVVTGCCFMQYLIPHLLKEDFLIVGFSISYGMFKFLWGITYELP